MLHFKGFRCLVSLLLSLSSLSAISSSADASSPTTIGLAQCSEVVANGDFELGAPNWTVRGTAAIGVNFAHSGSRSAVLRPYSSTSGSAVEQSLPIPSNAVEGTLQLYAFSSGSEYDFAPDELHVKILDAAGNPIQDYMVHPGGGTADTAWRLVTLPFTNMRLFAGQTLRLWIGAVGWQTGYSHTTFYVDDVSWQACTLSPTTTATLTPSVTVTPSATATPSTTPTSSATGTAAPSSTPTPSPSGSPPPPTETNTPAVSAFCLYFPLILFDYPPTPTATATNTATATGTATHTATSTATPTRTFTPTPVWVTIAEEDFEGDFPKEKWWVDYSTRQGIYTFAPRECQPHAGTRSGWAVGGGANGQALACGSNYPISTTSQLLYGPFDLSDAIAAKVTYWSWSYTEYQKDTIYLGASTNPWLYWGERSSGISNSWRYKEFNLAYVPSIGSLLGEPEAYIMFSFESDASYTRPTGWLLDDIRIVKLVRGVSSTDASPAAQPPGEPAVVRSLHGPAIDQTPVAERPPNWPLW